MQQIRLRQRQFQRRSSVQLQQDEATHTSTGVRAHPSVRLMCQAEVQARCKQAGAAGRNCGGETAKSGLHAASAVARVVTLLDTP
jgi:hypothetical protein